MWLGSGTVKGFAYTLALGIVISMFTALVVSRLIVNALYAVGVVIRNSTDLQKNVRQLILLERRKYFLLFPLS